MQEVDQLVVCFGRVQGLLEKLHGCLAMERGCLPVVGDPLKIYFDVFSRVLQAQVRDGCPHPLHP